jgi:hypothetical protein
MVSGDGNCNIESELNCDDYLSLSHYHASSLDLNTSSTINALHACVYSSCISCASCMNKSHDDMLDLSCFHDTNISTSSSCCVSNNVEENKYSLGQDKILIRSSSDSSSSSLGSHTCLMARSSKVTPTLEPNISSDDDEDNEKEDFDFASLIEKSEMFFHAIRKNKIACSYFYKILAFATESNKIIEDHENTIFKMQGHARDYADEIADLKEALEEEQTTKESLEETFTLELSKVKKSHEGSFEVENDSRVVLSEPIILTESHEQLKASNSNELTKIHSPLSINDDACATNSTSCEASILKENVELTAQFDLLSTNYGKLEESHGKLSSSHEDLLPSHDRLKLAHEDIISKVTDTSPTYP